MRNRTMPNTIQQWLAVLSFVVLFHISAAAFKGFSGDSEPCPKPCRCLLFGGVWSVYCNRTGIEAVPTGIPRSTQLLDLSDNNIKQVSRDAFAGLVNLEELDLGGNDLQNAQVENGAFDLPKLATMDMSYNSLTNIPDYLPKTLTKLWFFNNGVKVLKTGIFAKYSALQYLDVSQNGIETIEIGAFNPLKNISTLYLPFNKLNDSSIPPNTFSSNQNLELLGLRFNNLTQLLRNLPVSLQHLDYVGNRIKTLPSYAFRSLPNLQSMGFWQGQVTTIEDNAFFGLNNLTILDFMQDTISSTITKDTFNGLTGLQTLYMDLNNISRIEPGAFRSFSSVTSLWFSDNHMTSLDPDVLDVRNIPHLSELYIDGNPWYCDCHLRWLREKVNNATYVIQDPHLITCAGPSKVAGKAWDILQPSDFVCP